VVLAWQTVLVIEAAQQTSFAAQTDAFVQPMFSASAPLSPPLPPLPLPLPPLPLPLAWSPPASLGVLLLPEQAPAIATAHNVTREIHTLFMEWQTGRLFTSLGGRNRQFLRRRPTFAKSALPGLDVHRGRGGIRA